MKTMLKQWTVLAQRGLFMLAVLALASCGGGGVIPAPGVSRRALDADFTNRKAVAYSPYRTATNEAGLAAESIPAEQHQAGSATFASRRIWRGAGI
jgi:hypothetical protein